MAPPLTKPQPLNPVARADRANRATYHPKGYGVSEGLVRARRPFRTKNAITGALIAGFAFSVYAYSIRAVKQEDFADIEMPSEGQRAVTMTIEEELREKERLKAELKDDFFRGGEKMEDRVVKDVARKVEKDSQTIWAYLTGGFGGRGADSILVHGAPPVDRVGRVQDRTTDGGRRLV